MDIDQLLDTAYERAGSDDLGEDAWREALEVYVHALDTEAGLNEVGTGAMQDQIVAHLVNRLRIEQWYARHPEIDDEEIVAPLFGLGMPRTASTALGYLLSRDPARRSLRNWEASDPCPPPEAATSLTDPRIAVAQEGIDFTNLMFPGFSEMLPSEADGPQECLVLMCLDFRSQMLGAMARVPSYSSWLMNCDMSSTYRHHKRVLKLLQWRCGPKRWSLRSPAHMLSIAALNEVYPDARFVMTHRDVGKVLPSVCALYDSLSSVLAEEPDPIGIGRENMEVWRTALERLIEFRAAGHEHRFHDLMFADMQKDPIAAVSGLYADLGDELTDVAREGMSNWWTENTKNRPAVGSYPAEKYGLDFGVIDDQFGFYYDRFKVPVAPPGRVGVQ